MQLIARPYTVSDAADVALNTAARHTQNTDTKLDNGGDNEVTAAQAKAAYSHVSADGSSHADVATNSAARHTQGTDTTLGAMTAALNLNNNEIQGASQIGCMSIDASSYGMFGGNLRGGINVISTGSNYSPGEEICRGDLILVTAARTITLPAVADVIEGGMLTVYSTAANLIKVDLNDNDRFILDGVALSDAHMLDSESGAGNYVTLIKDSADGWTVIGRSGVWTDGGTS